MDSENILEFIDELRKLLLIHHIKKIVIYILMEFESDLEICAVCLNNFSMML